MQNIKGDEISEERMGKISRKISNLPEKKIDRLFHNLGFVVSKYKGNERPKEYKALFPEQIEEIQSGNSDIIRDLLFETGIEDVKRELGKIESE